MALTLFPPRPLCLKRRAVLSLNPLGLARARLQLGATDPEVNNAETERADIHMWVLVRILLHFCVVGPMLTSYARFRPPLAAARAILYH